MDLLLGPGVSHPLTPINQHHPTQSQSSLLSNHSETRLGSTVTIWSTQWEEGRWATTRRVGSTARQATSRRQTVLPSTQLLSNASIGSGALNSSSHIEILPHSNRAITLGDFYLSFRDPKRAEESEERCAHSLSISSPSLNLHPYQQLTCAQLGLTYFTSFCIKTLKSHHRWRKRKPWSYPKSALLLWPIHPQQHLLLNPPSFSLFKWTHYSRESKMVLSCFSLAPSNYSGVPHFCFLRKGTKKSAPISKANVIKQ